jgi:hypothetical protein
MYQTTCIGKIYKKKIVVDVVGGKQVASMSNKSWALGGPLAGVSPELAAVILGHKSVIFISKFYKYIHTYIHTTHALFPKG